MQLVLPLFALLLASVSSHEIEKREAKATKDGGGKRVVCYYTNWSVYRKGLAKFTPQNINPYMCTHLVYAFGGLTDEFEVTAFDSYQDIEQGGYAQFNGLKQYNKGMKTLLALGGWNEGSSRFSELVSLKEYRDNFTRSALRHLRRYNFDGLDLDWEYPGSRDGSTIDDKENYALLVQELREAFEFEASKSSKERLLLTMAAPAGETYIDRGYNIPKLNKHLDFFNLLTYDYHSVYEPIINHHAGLFLPPGISEFEVNYQLNVDWTVRHYLKNGASKDKLVVGIPTYGRSYTLLDADFFSLGSSANGPGAKGNYTNEKGYLAFYEVCEAVAVGGWEVRKPYPKRLGPFAFKGNQWVGYDDEHIVIKKAEYVRDNSLGGVMFWTVDSDDFRGLCNGRQFPLIEAAKEALIQSSPTSENEARALLAGGSARNDLNKIRATTTTAAPKRRRPGKPGLQTATIDFLNTPEPPTTPSTVQGFNCKREGFYSNPDDCHKYYWCLDSGASGLGIVAHGFTCPSDLIFNKKIDGCDHPDRGKCKVGHKNRGGAKSTTTAPPIPPTTEFEYLLEDYEYYYDFPVDQDPAKPLPDPTRFDEEPLLANVITPTRNSGGSQFTLPREPLVGQPAPEKEEIFTKLPAGNAPGSRARPQYASIQRDRTRVTEQFVEENGPISDRQESTPEKQDVASRQRRPQYVTLNRQHPTAHPVEDNVHDNLREELGREITETATESSGSLQYVTLNRIRQPTTESPVNTEERATDAGLEYVTLRRERLENEVTSAGTNDHFVDIPEAAASATTPTPTSTTSATLPKIRLPPRLRVQNREGVRPKPTVNPAVSTRRRTHRVRGQTNTQLPSRKEEVSTLEKQVKSVPAADDLEVQEPIDPVAAKLDTADAEIDTKANHFQPITEPDTTITKSLTSIVEKDVAFKSVINSNDSKTPDTSVDELRSTLADEEASQRHSEAGGSLLEETLLLFQQNSQKQTETPATDFTERPFIISDTELPSIKAGFNTDKTEDPEAANIPVEPQEPVASTPTRPKSHSRTRNPDRSRLPPTARLPPRSGNRTLPHKRPIPPLRFSLLPAPVQEEDKYNNLTRSVEKATIIPNIFEQNASKKTDGTETEMGLPVKPLRVRPGLRLQESGKEAPAKEDEPGLKSELSEIPEKDQSSPTLSPFSFIDIFTSTTQEPERNISQDLSLILAPTRSTHVDESSTKFSFPLHPGGVPEEESATQFSKPSFIFDVSEAAPPKTSKTLTTAASTETQTKPTTEGIFTAARPRFRLTPTPVKTLQPEEPDQLSARPRSHPRTEVSTTSRTQRPLSQRPSRPLSTSTQNISSLAPAEYEYVYDYYDGAHGGSLGDLATLSNKARIRPDGTIECKDTGYFPHPESCKKFISCSKTVRGFLRGWIYTCPQELVFDPVGGMCNWTESVDCLAKA